MNKGRREFLIDAISWATVGASAAGVGALRWRRARRASKFPERAVTLICPYAPGGGTDMLVRYLAHAAEPVLGVPVVVNNLVGGGGAVGFAAGRMARADGYTGVALTFEVISLPLRGLAPFTHDDFDALMLLNIDPAVIAVRADHPARSLGDLIGGARAGEVYRVGNSGPGAVWHLAAALFAQRAGVSLRHVPYGGATPAVTALIGGHVDAVVAGPVELLTHIRSGGVRSLAAMSEARLAALPETPTCRELGFDLVFGTWRGLALPRGVAPAVRAVWVETFERAAGERDVLDFARESGMSIVPRAGEEFRSLMRRQSLEVGEVMASLGMIR